MHRARLSMRALMILAGCATRDFATGEDFLYPWSMIGVIAAGTGAGALLGLIVGAAATHEPEAVQPVCLHWTLADPAAGADTGWIKLGSADADQDGWKFAQITGPRVSPLNWQTGRWRTVKPDSIQVTWSGLTAGRFRLLHTWTRFVGRLEWRSDARVPDSTGVFRPYRASLAIHAVVNSCPEDSFRRDFRSPLPWTNSGNRVVHRRAR
jgi:hypothetical protein